MTPIIATVAAALVLGLIARRFYYRRGQPDGEHASLKDLVSPLETLGVLVLAFVLVVAAQSYDKANDAVVEEAGVTDHLFGMAEFLPPAQAQALQGQVVCYARAVLAQEWPVMESGRSADGVSTWSRGFRDTFRNTNVLASPAFESLVEADKARSDARQKRLSEATPSISAATFLFMLVALATLIIGYLLILPRENNRLHIAGVAVLAALFAASLMLIHDIDRPFSGLVAIDAAEFTDTRDDITNEYATTHGVQNLPCNDAGVPKIAATHGT